jgi:hypothetical protein
LLEKIYASKWRELASKEGQEKRLPDNRGWVRRDEVVESRARIVAEALRNGPMNKTEIGANTGIVGYPLVEALGFAIHNLSVVKMDQGRATKYGFEQ